MNDRPLIIGIHGLSNKPEPEVLAQSWRDAIVEGFRSAGRGPNAGDEFDFDFELVYWAHKLYSQPLHRKHEFAFTDPLYNDEPYVPAAEVSEGNDGGGLTETAEKLLSEFVVRLRRKADVLDRTLGPTADHAKEVLQADEVTKTIIRKGIKDLDVYYSNEEKRNEIRGLLTEVLEGATDRKVMLVGHSMGSIIAYDTLKSLDALNSAVRVDTLVTIGSPLGLFTVKEKAKEEFATAEGDLTVPDAVVSIWVNQADERDVVAFDGSLREEYRPNVLGRQCVDQQVDNNYQVQKLDQRGPDENPHKSYGYLRTSQFAKLAGDFLGLT